MTLQNLKYMLEISNSHSFSKAAKNLFVSQSTLSAAVKELESDLGITIFKRTNRGVSLTYDGEDFIKYAKEIVEQSQYLEQRYHARKSLPMRFSVSCQHYSFAVNAFVDLIKEYGQDNYDFSLRGTQTYEIIDDVAKMRSELGILFLNEFNEVVLTKIPKSHDLSFHPLFTARPHVFVSRSHPLAQNTVITNEELEAYPYLSFEQGEHNSFYFSDEIFSSSERRKNIRVRDRATLFNLLIGLNGYTVCSGVIDENLNGSSHLNQSID